PDVGNTTWDGRVFVGVQNNFPAPSKLRAWVFRPENVERDPEGRLNFGAQTLSAPADLEFTAPGEAAQPDHFKLPGQFFQAVSANKDYPQNPYPSDAEGNPVVGTLQTAG